MAGTPPPLWPGYDDASEDDLLDLLDRRVEVAKNANDPTVDERAGKDFALAIESHEWLKQNRFEGAGHRPRLQARAREVRVGSWRPRK